MKNIDDPNKLAIYDVFVSFFFNFGMHLSLQLFHFNVFNFRKIFFFSFCYGNTPLANYFKVLTVNEAFGTIIDDYNLCDMLLSFLKIKNMSHGTYR